MAHALTESSTFTASITVPDGGDPRTAASVELPFQGVANRTRNHEDRIQAVEALNIEDALDDHEDRLDAIEGADTVAQINVLKTFAYYDFTSDVKDSGERFALTEVIDSSPSGNFSYSDGRVTVPAAGTYEITVLGKMGVTSGTGVGVYLRLDSTLLVQQDDAAGTSQVLAMGAIAVITTPASQRINIVAIYDNQLMLSGAKIVIKRLS
jgi:hypothetical protein